MRRCVADNIAWFGCKGAAEVLGQGRVQKKLKMSSCDSPKKIVSFKKLKIQPKNQDYYTLNHKILSPPPSTAGEKEGQKAHRAQLSHLRANFSACWILRLTTE